MKIQRQAGFTLVELMITMVIFIIVIVAAANIFSGLLNEFKQQSKIAETHTEGLVGLEIFRFDLEQAGFGLPWTMTWIYNGVDTRACYSEANSYIYTKDAGFNYAVVTGNNYNDSGLTCPPVSDNTPRAVVAGENVLMNGSDLLILKAANISTSDTVQKWTYLTNISGVVNQPAPWPNPGPIAGPTPTPIPSENLANGDWVIAMKPNRGTDQKVLVNNGATAFYTAYNSNIASFATEFQPVEDSDTYLIYGVKNGKKSDNTATPAPRMPFNRADYFVRRFDASGNNITPSRCAPNTGVLTKGVVDNSGSGTTAGKIDPYLPLLDCVADMQVVFRLDADMTGNGNGSANTSCNANGSYVLGPSGVTPATVQPILADAAKLRTRLREVRVYILAHEGTADPSFNFTSFTGGGTSVIVGDPLDSNLGSVFDLKARICAPASDCPFYANYRWKVYTIAVQPYNLR